MARKKWWLMVIVVFLVLFGALIMLTEGSALGTFIYTLFSRLAVTAYEVSRQALTTSMGSANVL